MRSDLRDIEVVFQHQTEKASCEIDPADPDRGDTVTLTARKGVLIEKGLV